MEHPPPARSAPRPLNGLSHPASAAPPLQVERLLDVYQQEGGPERLQSMAVPLLSWDDYKAIKEEGNAATSALPAGTSGMAAAGGRLLPGGESKCEGGAVEAASAEAAGGSTGSNAVPGDGCGREGQEGSGGVPVAAGEPAAADDGPHATGGAAADDTASESGSVDIDELCQLD